MFTAAESRRLAPRAACWGYRLTPWWRTRQHDGMAPVPTTTAAGSLVAPRGPLECHCTRPCIWWYPEPLPPWDRTNDQRLVPLKGLLKDSPYYTTDGGCAQFFFISNPLASWVRGDANRTLIAQMYDGIKRNWPWWNRTAGRGLVRHFILNPCDHGPRDCEYGHTTGALTPDIDPDSAKRRVGFIVFNGVNRFSAFQRGLDIRVPPTSVHQCGPMCGMRGLNEDDEFATIRALSPWSELYPEAERARLFSGRRRQHRFFWSGLSRRGSGAREDLFKYHSSLRRKGFVLHDTWREPNYPDNLPPGANVSDPHWYVRTMAQSDFCFAPPGQSNGDSDRYLPAILYGCVPVFADESEYGPFAEVIPWDAISLRVGNKGINVSPARRMRIAPERPESCCAQGLKQLHLVLANISEARLGAMRRAMRDVWTRLLYKPTGQGTYTAPQLSDLGVTRQLTRRTLPGAVETLAQVLVHRLDGEHVVRTGGATGEVECVDVVRCGAK